MFVVYTLFNISVTKSVCSLMDFTLNCKKDLSSLFYEEYINMSTKSVAHIVIVANDDVGARNIALNIYGCVGGFLLWFGLFFRRGLFNNRR